MKFDSLGEFGNFLEGVSLDKALNGALETIGQAVEATAKSEFGVYQPPVGQFQKWPELADATKAERVALGFSANEPLLRTGELRDSISHEVDKAAGEVAIGSTDQVMVYQELGTSRIPPRPVLGPAVLRNFELIKETAGRAVLVALLPKGVARPETLSLYNFTDV